MSQSNVTNTKKCAKLSKTGNYKQKKKIAFTRTQIKALLQAN